MDYLANSDSYTLHDQAENNYPRQGVFALRKPLKTCLQKVYEKVKNHAQHGSCFLFAVPEQGDGDSPKGGEHPLHLHRIFILKVNRLCRLLHSF